MRRPTPLSYNSIVKDFLKHPVLPAAFFAFLVWQLNVQIESKNEQKYLNPPPEHIEYFHFGFRESLADSFWLRWIQDNDHCQTYDRKTLYNLEPIDPKTVDKDITSVPRYKICDNSWSFKMLDAVTRLAPKFWMPYQAGASTLAILVEDFEGASVIYERGLKEYPNDWQLLFRASFHYQFNLKDVKRAAELLLRASELGAPPWTRSLAARLYTHSGQVELGLSVLESYRKTMDESNEDAVKQVDKRIAELREKLKNLNK